jgi:hypothetical protein
VLAEHLHVLLPVHAHHVFHRFVHDLLLQGPHAPAYHHAFLATLVRRFGDVCGAGSARLAELLLSVFTDAFVSAADGSGPLPGLVHELVLRVLRERDAAMLELFVWPVFHFLTRSPRRPRLLALAAEFKKDQFSFAHVLRGLADDAKSETRVGVLALLVYFVLQPPGGSRSSSGSGCSFRR